MDSLMAVLMAALMADEKADPMVGKKDVMVVDQRVGVLVEKLVGTSAEQWGGETEEVVVDDWVDETVEMMGAYRRR